MSDLADLTPDEARKFAQLELEYITPLRDTLIEEHSASYRWLMASLLAINAGGLLAIKDSVHGLSGFGWLPGMFFFLGVGFAFLIALVGQKSTQMALVPMTNLSIVLMAAIVSGEYDMERVRTEQTAYQAAIKHAWLAQVSGWLSFIMFASALVTLGIMSDESVSHRSAPIVISR